MQILKAYKFRLEPTAPNKRNACASWAVVLPCLESRAGRDKAHSGCWRKTAFCL